MGWGVVSRVVPFIKANILSCLLRLVAYLYGRVCAQHLIFDNYTLFIYMYIYIYIVGERRCRLWDRYQLTRLVFYPFNWKY